MTFAYHEPRSIGDAVEMLRGLGEKASVLAGGTALLIDIQHGELVPEHLVSLWQIPGLQEVRLNGETRIGALASLTDLIEATAGETPLQGLREAGRMVGAKQIQNMATLGGNICKASPGADMVPPLLCLDATLKLHGPKGERTSPLDGFLVGPDQISLGPAEILTSIQLPRLPPRTGTAFAKIMRRQAIDCSIVSVAARVALEEDGRNCAEARVGIAAASPNPFRAREAEAILDGAPIDRRLASEAARAAVAESDPIDDVRASAAYRRTLVEVLVKRTVLLANARAAA